MRLTIYTAPNSITFEEPNSGGAYPLLVSVGALRLVARAGTPTGIGSTETPNITVSLNNSGKRAATMLGRPLRVRAELYDDAGASFFAGTISRVDYDVGRLLTLQIDG